MLVVLHHGRRRSYPASDLALPRSLPETAQNHVSGILDKHQAADRTQAALRARGISPAPTERRVGTLPTATW
jgi:hypothetical protein